MNVVSVSGLIGSGKDTVAQHLIDNHGFVRISFSAALKDAVGVIFGFDREMLDGITKAAREEREIVDPWWTKKLQREVSPRSLLQEFGTRVMRDSFDQSIWVLALERRIEMASDGKDAKLVASDARFFNEMGMIRSLGGVNLRVTRSSAPWVQQFKDSVNAELQRRNSTTLDKCNLSEAIVAGHVRKVGHQVAEATPEMASVHPSEWEHTLWTGFKTIANDSSLSDLYSRVDSVLSL